MNIDIKNQVKNKLILMNNASCYKNQIIKSFIKVGLTPPPYNFQKNTYFINESGL